MTTSTNPGQIIPGTDAARKEWGERGDPNFPAPDDDQGGFEIESGPIGGATRQPEQSTQPSKDATSRHSAGEGQPHSEPAAAKSPLEASGVSRRSFLSFVAGSTAATAANRLIAGAEVEAAKDQANRVNEATVSLLADRRMSVASQDLGYCNMLLSAAGKGFAPLAKEEDFITASAIATGIERDSAKKLARDATNNANGQQPPEEASSLVDKFRLACTEFQTANHKANPLDAPDAITDAQLILALGVAYDASANMYDGQSQEWYNAFSTLKGTQALIDFLSNNVATTPGEATMWASPIAAYTATFATRQGLDAHFVTLGETASADSNSMLIGTTQAIGQALRKAAELAGVHFLEHSDTSQGK